MMTMKVYLLVLLLVVGVSAGGEHFEDKCKFEDKLYDVGQIIQFFPHKCMQNVCRKNNNIQHEAPDGITDKARGCCKCHNKMYHGKSQTCVHLKETEECPALCGKKWAHGDILETNLAKCTRKRCLNGQILNVHPVGKEKTGCCLEIKGRTETMIAHGSETTNGGCVPEICSNGGWIPSPAKIVNTCKKCRVFNDPHFSDFNGRRFDWHLGCNHALVQEGNTYNPDFGVFMDFTRGGTISNMGETTYQEDKNTKVVLNPMKTQVTVNGHQQDITGIKPTFLVGPDGTKTTALAWKHGHCIRLYGKPKILVELCKHQITIWSSPWNAKLGLAGVKKQAGLCGKTEERFLKNRMLIDRNGNEYPKFNAKLGTSWKTADQKKAECQAAGRRKKRYATEVEAEALREACDNVMAKDSPYLAKCRPVIEDSGLTGPDRDNLLNACLFDLCIVANDPGAPVTEEEMLNQHKDIAVESKDQEDNTVVVPAETKCPAEWSLVGVQCYQAHLFTKGLSFDNAQEHCLSEKASLAQPRDLKATKNFLRGTIVALKDEGTAKCPAEWCLVGDQCYQAHLFTEFQTIDNAHKHCLSQNASLAQPRDLHATKNFLKSTLQAVPKKDQGHGVYWLAGRHKGGAMQWLIGGDMIPFGRPHEVPYSCLEMRPHHDNKYSPLATVNCKRPEGYICEISLNLMNGHHKGGATQWLIGGVGKNPYNCLQLQPLLGDNNPPLTTNDCIKPEGYICEKETLACGDEDDECVWRAADGECDGNRAYMYNFCKASCNVACDCDQPDTCTVAGGKCQPQGDKCDAVSDPTLCSGDSCSCCYVPDPCHDAEDEDCESYVEQGYCESEDDYILEELARICSLSCGFCEPY